MAYKEHNTSAGTGFGTSSSALWAQPPDQHHLTTARKPNHFSASLESKVWKLPLQSSHSEPIQAADSPLSLSRKGRPGPCLQDSHAIFVTKCVMKSRIPSSPPDPLPQNVGKLMPLRDHDKGEFARLSTHSRQGFVRLKISATCSLDVSSLLHSPQKAGSKKTGLHQPTMPR